MCDSPFMPTYLDALFAHEALRRGPVCTMVSERLGTVIEEVLWSETAPGVRAWIQSPQLEARLLAGLGVAASLALIEVQLSAVHGREGAYLVRWQRRAVLAELLALPRAANRGLVFGSAPRAPSDIDRPAVERRDRSARHSAGAGVERTASDDARGYGPGPTAGLPHMLLDPLAVAV